MSPLETIGSAGGNNLQVQSGLWDFQDLEEGVWKAVVGDEDSYGATEEHPSPISSPVRLTGDDSIHDSPFSSPDLISSFGDGQDPWLAALRAEGRSFEGQQNSVRSVSPTVPFTVQDPVYVPLSFDQCLQLIISGPPIDEGSELFVSHPGFVPFFFRLGTTVDLQEECLTQTAQGIRVVAQHGQWLGKCVVCLRGAAECEGCRIPVLIEAGRPSSALPRSLQHAASIFDQWKLSGLRGFSRVQSFAAVLNTSLSEGLCWRADVDGEKEVFLLFDPSWLQWFRPQVGLSLAVMDAVWCGTFDDCPVFLVGEEVDEPTRCLELCAGIGGWSASLPFLDACCGVVSIELDPERAMALGKMKGCPVVPVELILPDLLEYDLVILGDVRDRKWLKLTLAWPFRVLLQSPPCTSFSGGGNQMGIHDEAGLLMLHGLGIASVIHADVACGENVKGLIRHPHWPIIGLFAHMLGLRNLQVKLLELSHIVPMKRPRCFFLFFRTKIDFPINDAQALVLPKELWQISDQYVDEINEEQRKILSVWDLLPFPLKKVCQKSPEKVLAARTHDTLPLPVLMASYRHQYLLPPATLASKGLFTWLVRFDQKLRYLHPCEAARLLGFGPEFLFGVDLDDSLTALGNSVSPIQVLQILRPVFAKLGILRELGDAPMREVVALLVCGWTFLGHLAVRRFGDSLNFVHRTFGIRDQNGPVLVRYAGSFRWVSSCGLFDGNDDPCRRLSEVLGFGHKVITFCCRFWEDVVEVFVELEPSQVHGINFVLHLPPSVAWKSCLELLEMPIDIGHLKALRPDAPLWMVPRYKLHFPVCFWTNDEVIIFVRGQRKVTPWIVHQNITFFLRQVLPFPVAIKWLSTRDVITGGWVGGEDEILPGCYQVDFHLCEVPIAPFGKIQVHPLDTVGQVQAYLGERMYGGKLTPMITVGGRSVAADTLIVAANCFGALRVRVFPLKGGAMSLAATEEKLRDLLKEHGVDGKDLKARVADIVEKLSYETCKKCLDAKTPWAALKAEATKHNLRLVTVLERESKSSAGSSSVDPLIENDPWKGASFGKGKRAGKAVPKEPKPVQLKIDESFFHVQGNPLPVISVEDLMKGASGLVVEQLHSIGDRLAVISHRSRSTGPAALLVCGCSTRDLPEEVATSKCNDVVVPGWVGPHSSAIRSVLIQVGDVEVQYQTTKAEIVVQDHVATKVVMVHVYKDESKHWEELRRGVAFFLRRLGFQETNMIQQAWGLGFYAGTKKVRSEDAIYAHGFLRILDGFLGPLLQISGTDGMYVTPRTSSRTVDPNYKVITFPEFGLDDVKRQRDLLDDVFGLVRTGKGYGVRVHESKYASARKVLFPDLEISDESDSGGPRRFRMMAVPAEYERATLKALLKKVGWKAKVLRGQGVGTWMVSAIAGPPVRSIEVNEATIVILEDQVQMQRAILASTSRNVVNKTTLQVAPYEVNAIKSTPLLPEVKSKFEQLEAKANARVDHLEQQVSALAVQVQEQAGKTNTAIQSLEGKVEHIAKMEDRFELVLKKFGQQQEQRVQRLEEQQQATLNEIKMAIEQSPKVRKVETQAHP